jgi:putative ABC transport system ATP-binding protein
LLQAEALALDYSSGETVARAVDGVSLTLEPGTFTGLIGPSGSGKSSLMYLLSGLKRPTSGRVQFGDSDYSRLSGSALMGLRRRHFGFVFQQHFLVNYLSALENVMVGALVQDSSTRRFAAELLERVGLAGKIRVRPYELSVGMRQRVAVARALIHRPAVVFADEPTAALDQATGHQVIDLLRAYRDESGGSVLVVTHDPAMLQGAGRVLQMRDGRLMEAGESGLN